MKAAYLSPTKLLQIHPYLLLTTAAALITAHLTLVWRADKPSLFALSIVFWLATISIVWDKRRHLKLTTDIFSCLVGVLIILGTFVTITSPLGVKLLGSYPFTSALGLALIASGSKNLRQYRQELIILFFLGLPRILPKILPNIAPATAHLSAYLLWYSGFDVSLQGVNITLPNGGVEVVPSCSGLNLMIYMLGLAVIYRSMFPTNNSQKVIAPVVAITIGFLVNGIRIAILAVLSSHANHQHFEYWHSKEGALIFIVISVLLFGYFCLFSLRQVSEKN